MKVDGRGIMRLKNINKNNKLVEAAGIEPASVSPLPSALHAYPGLLI